MLTLLSTSKTIPLKIIEIPDKKIPDNPNTNHIENVKNEEAQMLLKHVIVSVDKTGI